MKAIMYKPSERKKFNRVDSDEHWPKSIKKKIQWFPFLTNMEHNTPPKKGLISSFLKVFAMFEIRLSYEIEKLDVVYLKCINCKR